MQSIKVLVLGVVSFTILFLSEAHAAFSLGGFCKGIVGKASGMISRKPAVSLDQALEELSSLTAAGVDLGKSLREKWKGEDFRELSKSKTPLQTCRDNKKELDLLLERLEMVKQRLDNLAKAGVNPKTADAIGVFAFSTLLLDGHFIYALRFFRKVEAGLKIYRDPKSPEHLEAETVEKIRTVDLEKWDETFRNLFRKIGPQFQKNIAEAGSKNSGVSLESLKLAVSELSAKQPNSKVGERSLYTLRTAVEASEFDTDARSLVETRRGLSSEFIKYKELSPIEALASDTKTATPVSTAYKRPTPKITVPDIPSSSPVPANKKPKPDAPIELSEGSGNQVIPPTSSTNAGAKPPTTIFPEGSK